MVNSVFNKQSIFSNDFPIEKTTPSFVRRVAEYLLRNKNNKIIIQDPSGNQKHGFEYQRSEVLSWIREYIQNNPRFGIIDTGNEKKLLLDISKSLINIEPKDIKEIANATSLDNHKIEDLLHKYQESQKLQYSAQQNLSNIRTADQLSIKEMLKIMADKKAFEEQFTEKISEAIIDLHKETYTVDKTQLPNLKIHADTVSKDIEQTLTNLYANKQNPNAQDVRSAINTATQSYSGMIIGHRRLSEIINNFVTTYTKKNDPSKTRQILLKNRTTQFQNATLIDNHAKLVGTYMQYGLSQAEAISAAAKFDNSSLPIDKAFINAGGKKLKQIILQKVNSGELSEATLSETFQTINSYKNHRLNIRTINGNKLGIHSISLGGKKIDITKIHTDINLINAQNGENLISLDELVSAIYGEKLIKYIAKLDSHNIPQLGSEHQMLTKAYFQHISTIRQNLLQNENLHNYLSQKYSTNYEEISNIFTDKFNPPTVPIKHFLSFYGESITNKLYTNNNVIIRNIGNIIGKNNITTNLISHNGKKWINNKWIGKGISKSIMILEKGALKKGIIGTVSKLGIKALGALGSNVLPGIGQVISIAMTADMLIDTFADKIPLGSQIKKVWKHSKHALTGAGIGAVIGSAIMPGVGTAIGAVLGAGAGFLWGHKKIAGAVGLGLGLGLAWLLSKFSALLGSMMGFAGLGLSIAGLATGNLFMLGVGLPMMFKGFAPFFKNLMSGHGPIANLLHSAGNKLTSIIHGGTTSATSMTTIAVGGAIGITAIATIINYQILMSAFVLPPYDKGEDFYQNNILNKQCNNIANYPMSGWPVSIPGRITQGPGEGNHTGRIMNSVDIAGVPGTNILATHDGVIIFAGYDTSPGPRSYGNLVIIQGAGFTTYYAHLLNIDPKISQNLSFSPSQNIHKGDVIGSMGTTGTSSGVHLHYEIRNQDRSAPYPDSIMCTLEK